MRRTLIFVFLLGLCLAPVLRAQQALPDHFGGWSSSAPAAKTAVEAPGKPSGEAAAVLQEAGLDDVTRRAYASSGRTLTLTLYRLHDPSGAYAAFTYLRTAEMADSDLAWDVLEAGMRSAGSVPVWIVNEPMFVSHGANSDIRYNTFYPRWAYDDYHMMWQDRCRVGGWVCLDLWDALPADAFTDSAVHYNPAGAESLAQRLAEAIGAAPSLGSVP